MKVEVIDVLTEMDVKQIAIIHKSNYPEDHLTSYFDLSLLEIYYSLIAHASEYIFIAKKNDQIIGYAFVGTSYGRVMTKLVKDNFLHVLKFSLRNTRMVANYIFNRLFASISSFKSSASIRLISITTDRKEKHYRVGSHIMDAILMMIKSKSLKLGLSVKSSNIYAINFYIKKGFLVEAIIDDKLFMVIG